MSSPPAREAFDLKAEPDARPRPLRPDPLRPELPAGPPPDRARRPVRHGQHVRDRLRRDHLGHPRLGPVQPDRMLQERGRPELRQRVHRPARRPARTRPAARHDGRWPSASSAGRRRSTRPAAATTTRRAGPCSSPAGRSRAAGSSASRTRSATPPRIGPVTTAEIAATVYHGLGIDLDTELPGPQGRPLRSSITASSRSRSCSESVDTTKALASRIGRGDDREEKKEPRITRIPTNKDPEGPTIPPHTRRTRLLARNAHIHDRGRMDLFVQIRVIRGSLFVFLHFALLCRFRGLRR